MPAASKLKLSPEELQLVSDPQWILTKRSIIETVNELFGQLAAAMQPHVAACGHYLPAAVVQPAPKMARGENYLQLPYVILDYPRCFEKENIFAIRTMFWWGNFFSVTLHLSGKYKTAFEKNILRALESGGQEYYICVNEEEWQHHFEPGNYRLAMDLDAGEKAALFARHRFIKIAVRFPLQQWNEMPALLENAFLEMLKLAAG